MSKDNAQNNLIAILGPTASGKTGLAARLAHKFSGEIVSADSRQVYRGMDIGTGKDLAEYEIDGQAIPCHLIDVVEPTEDFDLADYQKRAFAAIDSVLKKSKPPFLVGGSGLYLQAVVDGYILPQARPDADKRRARERMTTQGLFQELRALNPGFANNLNQSDRNNPRRLVRYLEVAEQKDSSLQTSKKARYNTLLLGIAPEQEELENKIYSRLMERLEKEDMIGEVERLNHQGVSWQKLVKFGLEYKWIAYYLQNRMDYDEMIAKLFNDIRKFAKRQLTWFKRWENQGRQIHWINDQAEAENLIEEFLGPNNKNKTKQT